MKTDKDDSEQATDEQSEDDSQNDAWNLHNIFTDERSMEFVDQIFDEPRDRPETFMRVMLIIYDHSSEPPVQDSLLRLMMAAYNVSVAHSDALDKYLDTLRAEIKQQSAAWS